MLKLSTGDVSVSRRGNVLVVTDDHRTSTPGVSCSVCDFILRDADDLEAFREYSCCNACAMKWAEARRAAWKDGWRPSQEDVEIFVREKIDLHRASLLSLVAQFVAE